MPAVAEPEWLTAAEVAAILRVSKMTVLRMINDGELPAIRVGRNRGQFRVPASAMPEYVAAAWVGGAPPADSPQPGVIYNFRTGQGYAATTGEPIGGEAAEGGGR